MLIILASGLAILGNGKRAPHPAAPTFNMLLGSYYIKTLRNSKISSLTRSGMMENGANPSSMGKWNESKGKG
jgi:hypothetical protein